MKKYVTTCFLDTPALPMQNYARVPLNMAPGDSLLVVELLLQREPPAAGGKSPAVCAHLDVWIQSQRLGCKPDPNKCVKLCPGEAQATHQAKHHVRVEVLLQLLICKINAKLPCGSEMASLQALWVWLMQIPGTKGSKEFHSKTSNP